MNEILTGSFYDQLTARREALSAAMAQLESPPDLVRLLREVDRALSRLGTPAFGQCVVCDGWMSEAEMQENPQRRYCLCELSEHGLADLQHDLDLAWEVQAGQLPAPGFEYANWCAHYRYLPARAVSGDYCDLIVPGEDADWFYFLAGDVAGKGIAAAYLMAQVGALVRELLDRPMGVDELVKRVNHHLSQRSPAARFVTLVAGRADVSGRVEIVNAGHCRPIVLRRSGGCQLDSSGLPLGILPGTDYTVQVSRLEPGDSILLYTDGINESRGPGGELYGVSSLFRVAHEARAASPVELAAACLDDLFRFRGATEPDDDTTLMVLRFGCAA